MDVRESYDSAARAYAAHLAGDLEHKPLDRHLLRRFAEEIRDRGQVADLGCGPGQVARYLHDQGVPTIGIDISAAMVACACELNPSVRFHVGDMAKLDLPTRSLAGTVSFYSIVHFTAEELGRVLKEMRRVLVDGGSALLAFHIGDEVVHTDDLFGAKVSLDFRFHQPEAVVKALSAADFATLELSEREPYAGVEYPSRRCYLLARAT